MESRCYHGGEGRTRMNQLRFTGEDIAVLIFGGVFLAAIIVIKKFGF